MELVLIYCEPSTRAQARALAEQLPPEAYPGGVQLAALEQLPQALEPAAGIVFFTPPYQTAGCWRLMRRLDELDLTGRLCSCVGACSPVCAGAAQAVQRVTARLLRRGALVYLPGICCQDGAVCPGVDCCAQDPDLRLSGAEFISALAAAAATAASPGRTASSSAS